MITLSDKKIYFLMLSGLIAGAVWLGFQLHNAGEATPPGSACLMKRVAGIPCPSCGSTRAAVAFLHGDISTAVMTNPMGMLMTVLLPVLAALFLFELITGKRKIPALYRNAESFVSRRPVAILLICLVLANWCWNIVKAL